MSYGGIPNSSSQSNERYKTARHFIAPVFQDCASMLLETDNKL